MQALMEPDGYGRLTVNNGGGPWSWEACAPSVTDCAPFAHGREIGTKGAGSKTVFRVRGDGATGVSPEWLGRLRQLSAPTVGGVVRANEFVSPLPGGWSGGWKGELSKLQLSACETADGRECTTLTDLHYRRECPASSSFALEARFAGEYLRVADRRVGPGPLIEPAYAVSSPYGGQVWGRSRSTSVAVLGRIEPPVAPHPGECGPPPPGTASISRRGVALVRCVARCHATLVASRAGRVARVSRQLPEQSALVLAPAAELRIPRRTAARLGAGRVRLVVRVDGRPAARRTVDFALG